MYQVIICHDEEQVWSTELESVVRKEFGSLGMSGSLLTFCHMTDDLDAAAGHQRIAVYLGSPRGRTSPTCLARIKEVRALGVLILPLLTDLSLFSAHVPDLLREFNAWVWSSISIESRTAVAHFLFRQLGITERQRRVFISYRRTDAYGMAVQLFERLHARGFQPFLDLFSIQPAVPVQAEIEQAMCDFAFLLLLESPDAATSQWVQSEVDYARKERLGLLRLSWCDPNAGIPNAAGFPTKRLSPTELVINSDQTELARDALTEAVEAVETQHARGLLRRRVQVYESVREFAGEGGRKVIELPDWRLWVEPLDGVPP